MGSAHVTSPVVCRVFSLVMRLSAFVVPSRVCLSFYPFGVVLFPRGLSFVWLSRSPCALCYPVSLYLVCFLFGVSRCLLTFNVCAGFSFFLFFFFLFTLYCSLSSFFSPLFSFVYLPSSSFFIFLSLPSFFKREKRRGEGRRTPIHIFPPLFVVPLATNFSLL